MSMNRRQFLQVSAGVGASLVLGDSLPVQGAIPACGTTPPGKDTNPYLSGHRIIDAHAHPSQFYYGRLGVPKLDEDESSTVLQLCEFGVEASAFAAVGDCVARGIPLWQKNFADDFDATVFQLSHISDYLSDITRVRLASDIPSYSATGVKPGAIMAIEGGEALVGNPYNVDYFHQNHYVRMITLTHRTKNTHPHTLGDQMSGTVVHNGLSPLGQQVLDRMIQLNMIIDVAHASRNTLLHVCEIVQGTELPVIDSHTSLLRDHYLFATLGNSRLRTLSEMEAVVNTGGVVCTWPLQCIASCDGDRINVEDWAEEIEYLMVHLGPDHVGLGTDGGGRLPGLVDGYINITHLDNLAHAMADRGMSAAHIHAYMGGNLMRVINQVLR